MRKDETLRLGDLAICPAQPIVLAHCGAQADPKRAPRPHVRLVIWRGVVMSRGALQRKRCSGFVQAFNIRLRGTSKTRVITSSGRASVLGRFRSYILSASLCSSFVARLSCSGTAKTSGSDDETVLRFWGDDTVPPVTPLDLVLGEFVCW